MGTKIAESGVGTIASDESASLSALHLQIGRECSTLSTSAARNFHIATLSLSMFRVLFDLFLYLLGDALKWFCPRKRCATGSSLRTFEKIIPPPGYRERSHGLRHSASIPIARQKNFAYLRINKLGVLDFCSSSVLSLRRIIANPRNIHYICP